MNEPYLLIGLRMASSSPARLLQFAEVMRELEELLVPAPLTELNTLGVYLVELPPAKGFVSWRRVSVLLDNWDQVVGDDLEWFVQLADPDGNELSYN